MCARWIGRSGRNGRVGVEVRRRVWTRRKANRASQGRVPMSRTEDRSRAAVNSIAPCHGTAARPSAQPMNLLQLRQSSQAAAMRSYDPEVAPDPQRWLALDEQTRISLAGRCHRKARIELPDHQAHAVIHAIVENQIAGGARVRSAGGGEVEKTRPQQARRDSRHWLGAVRPPARGHEREGRGYAIDHAGSVRRGRRATDCLGMAPKVQR